ncbi:MAG: hypothetical protein Q4C70_09490 [Planctomycetia bacterium]|nr:hypothetical protein [Planctomycetia bacterium]
MQELWQEAYKNGILNRLTVQQGMANLGTPITLTEVAENADALRMYETESVSGKPPAVRGIYGRRTENQYAQHGIVRVRL